jgi:FlaG/FlaF family flagellin (archaellin)
MSSIRKDTGTSPVVGVILMVALSVILSAIVATFVFSIGDSTRESATAGVAIETNHVTLTDKGNTDDVYVLDDEADSLFYTLTSAGDTAVLPPSNYTIIGVADGHETVLASTTVTDADATADGNYALRFDNDQDERVRVGDSAYNLDPREDSFTISIHAKYHDGSHGTVYLKGHSVESYGVEWRGSNLRAGVRDDAGNKAYQTVSVDWSQDPAVLVTVAFDASDNTGSIYIDGDQKGSFDYSGVTGSLYETQPWNFGGGSRLVGTHANSDADWTGDDARFYDRVLSDSEIDALSNGTSVDNGLTGHWTFDEGTGDATKNHELDVHNSLVNDPTWTTPLDGLSEPDD